MQFSSPDLVVFTKEATLPFYFYLSSDISQLGLFFFEEEGDGAEGGEAQECEGEVEGFAAGVELGGWEETDGDRKEGLHKAEGALKKWIKGVQ